MIEVGRWKVQLELAPEEIAFVYRKGLARGAEVCRRGTHEWRPLLTTPELHDALAKRASLAEMIEVAPTGSALTVSQTLAIADPALAALYLAHRSPQAPKSAPPPPPLLASKASKSAPPPPPPLTSKASKASKSAPPPPLPTPDTETTLPQLKPLLNRDSVPDWEDTPLLPLRIEPLRLAKQITLPSARALAIRSPEPVVVHARPAELSLVAAVAVVLTLVVTALTLRAEAPKLNALITNARSGHTQSQRPARPMDARLPASPTIPVVFWRDLPVEAGRAAAATLVSVSTPAATRGSGATSPAPSTRGASSGPNRASLARALGAAAAAARTCGDGPVSAQVVVTFGPSGVARNVHFSAAPRVALRSCVLNAVARAHIAPFEGEPVTVSKTLRW